MAPRKRRLVAAGMAVALGGAGGAEGADAGGGPAGYLELPGARCHEIVGAYPLGGLGLAWGENLLADAQSLCNADADCAGFMRYVGDHEAHCHDWCGRPQFCEAGGSVTGAEALSLNRDWVSHVKRAHLEPLGLLWGDGPPISRQPLLGPSGTAALPLTPDEVFRELGCDGFSTEPWAGPPVVLLSPPAAASQLRFPGACHVAYRPFGTGQADGAALDGVVTETPEKDLPIFSAAAPADAAGHSPGGAAAERPAWRYYLDPVPEFPVEGLGLTGRKLHTLSVYFLSADSRCSGPKDSLLSPDDVAATFPAEHIYVEDGTHATREKAFKHYQFCMLCGDFAEQPFPPQALVYSIAYVTYALVPEYLHWRGSRLFFHLPDASQGYRSLSMAGLEGYLSDIITNPKQEKVAEFKETFALLCQQMVWYRYREPARRRAEVAACALCDAKQRQQRRGSAAAAAAAGAQAVGGGGAIAAAARDTAAAVAVAFCAMSRRGAHELRRVVRETWGRAVAEAAPSAAQRFFVGRTEGVPLEDEGVGDVVELPVNESYRTLSLKAFSMLSWAWHKFPNLQWIVRHDDDVYLRAPALMAQLSARPPVRYYWGMFDHGSSPVRDPTHQHYNSYEQFPQQKHPAWGDIFPPYARGLLWAMSADLLGAVVAEFLEDLRLPPGGILDEVAANRVPHPDDPAIGVVVTDLVLRGVSINIDDRDFNSFSLNPSCNSTFSNIHNRTWVVHHVRPETMRCMWALDTADGAREVPAGNSAVDASERLFPDLCLCSTEAEEEEDSDPDGEPFWYDRQRFNSAR